MALLLCSQQFGPGAKPALPVLAQQKARDCLRRIETALKDIPGLDYKTSWDIPEVTQDATQDQAGVGESSSFDPK